MAKQYEWEINEPGEDGAEDVLHKVSLRCSMLLGKAVVTIDGTAFDISTKPFALRGTSQMFRLGEMAALLAFPKKGEPDVVIDGVCVRTGKPYAG